MVQTLRSWYNQILGRPHGSNTGSGDWSVDPNEPYWQTNSSFSPPLSRRWDQRFQSGLLYGSHGGVRLYGSSMYSNSKGSRGWVRSEQFPNHHYSSSDGALSYFSSSSDSFETQQSTPPLQNINMEALGSPSVREPASEPISFLQSTEGSSTFPFSLESTSHSDASRAEPMHKTHVLTHRNFPSRCSFMSKPIHPLSSSSLTSQAEEAHGFVATNNSMNSSLKSSRIRAEPRQSPGLSEPGTSHRGGFQWSSASSVDMTEDMSDQIDPETFDFSHNMSEGSKCGVCERLLSQRSPWSSRRIIKSGDMPIAGVLSCRHVYHAECLEQVTPQMQKHDPPCPLCTKLEEIVLDNRVVGRINKNNGFPRLKYDDEDEGVPSSRAWSCGQIGDCVEGTLLVPPRNSILLSRCRFKKHLSAQRNSSKDIPDSGKSRKDGSCSFQLFSGMPIDQGVLGCSSSSSGPMLKRW